MGKLTTHVLDTVSGKPAAGVLIRLLENGVEIKAARTNVDGRLDEPLIEETEGRAGTYELIFEIGAYFSKTGAGSGIFQEAVIRFEMEASGNYHVPLVCTPWAYSTYRGS